MKVCTYSDLKVTLRCVRGGEGRGGGAAEVSQRTSGVQMRIEEKQRNKLFFCFFFGLFVVLWWLWSGENDLNAPRPHHLKTLVFYSDLEVRVRTWTLRSTLRLWTEVLVRTWTLRSP